MLCRRGTLGAAVAACFALLLAACGFAGNLSPDGTTDVDSDVTDDVDGDTLPPDSPEGDLAIDLGSADFGAVPVGSASAIVFTITNTGAVRTGVLAATFSGGNAADFTRTTTCTTLAPSASCTVTVTFRPTAEGNRSAALTVSGSPGGSAQALLVGAGASVDGLTISPTSFTFSDTVVAQDSATQQFVVTNNGTAASGALTVMFSDSQFRTVADTCNGATLAPDATCTIDVVATPVTTGPKTATLSVQSSAGTVSAALAVTGLAGAPVQLVANPSVGNFPITGVGQTSSSQTFTISNTGSQASAALSVQLTGVDFDLVSETCDGVMLAPSATCSVVVAFNPQTAGMKTGTVTVAGPPASVTVALAGTSGTPPDLILSPDTAAFGIVTLNTPSAPRTFTVTNPGSIPSGTLAVSLTGTNAGQFQIATDNCSGMAVPPSNGTCTISVRYLPTAIGMHTASLVIQGNPGGSDTASLTGTGVANADIVANPTTASFGSVAVGATSTPQTITVSYAGTLTTGPLSVTSNSPRFVISADTCTGMTLTTSSCSFAISFAPNAAQAETGSITVMATPGGVATIAATGTGTATAALTIAPPSHDFGMVPLNTTSVSRRFVITNVGTAPTGTLTAGLLGATPAAFDIVTDGCSMTTLAAGSACNVDVVFEPTSAVVSTASLSVSGAPGGTVAATLRGTGTAAAAIDSSADTLAFGSVAVGATGMQSVTITNAGTATSGTVAVGITGPDAARFGVASNTCMGQTLDPMETCSFSVTFSPTATGARSATLNVSATPGGALAIPLTGTGLAAALLDVDPTSEDFGTVAIGAPTSAITVTVINNGGTTTAALTVMLGGVNPTHFDLSANTCSGVTLAPTQSCTFGVRFDPTTTGSKSAVVNITATGTPSAQVTLSGVGATAADLDIAPSMRDFGTVIVGDSSGPQTFTVSNIGGSASGTITMSFTGLSPMDYDIVNDDCGGTSLAAGASCAVEVEFVPTSAGTKSATLRASSTPGGAATAALTGEAIDAAGLSITPMTKNFGSVSVGSRSATQVFTVRNIGALALTIDSAEVSGAFPIDFEITVDSCSGMTLILAVAPTCTIEGRFVPESTGPKNATFVVRAAEGPSATATVNGSGT